MLLRPLPLITLLLATTLVQAAPLPVEEAAPGVFVHHGTHKDIDADYGGDICNIGFIVGERGVAVIDTGGSANVGRQLREAIRNVTDKPILYVINTHIHPDHIFGNAAFKQDNPVFVGHEKLAAAMAQRKDAYLRNQSQWVGADAADSEIIPPSLAVKTTHTLDLGGRTLQLTAHPTAHTNNDLSVLDSQSATLWSGDLVFVERTPSVDGDLQGWLNVIDQLRNVNATRVVPGHGPVTADWKTALDNEQRYLAGLLQDIRAAIKAGKTMEQTMETANRGEQGKWALFDIVNRRNVNTVFPALEWE